MPNFQEARDFLLAQRDDYSAAVAGFRWPDTSDFNWALDFFDVQARSSDRPALHVVNENGAQRIISFAGLSVRSNQVANFLRELGVRRGDRILVMLPNIVPLWEITLAALKLGAVLSPAATLLTVGDVAERLQRGQIRHVITDMAGAGRCASLAEKVSRIVVGDAPTPGAYAPGLATSSGWRDYAEASTASILFAPDGLTRPDDPFLLYFTSGTTDQPKMVLHTQRSYPVGHLTTMYWIGLRPGDVHWNISSPGWAKHAYSCVFAPWNAGATVFIYQLNRFDAKKALEALVRYQVTTLCAPPTVWRLLILEDLAAYPVKLREAISAGEPLNPEVIERVQRAWGVTIRDGYGQTETTLLVGNCPGQPVKIGSMGRPLPGYRMTLLDANGQPAETEGEIAIDLAERPAGLMAAYLDNPERSAELLGGAFYRTSDVGRIDEDGYFWYVGRSDDVFKSSDYRLSPFELESALLEHASVAEAAVVPSPDPIRLSVPKAFIVLKPGVAADRDTAVDLFQFIRGRLAPFQRIRRIEFGELPKTLSGKIRRVELRQRETSRPPSSPRGAHEFWEEDLPV